MLVDKHQVVRSTTVGRPVQRSFRWFPVLDLAKQVGWVACDWQGLKCKQRPIPIIDPTTHQYSKGDMS